MAFVNPEDKFGIKIQSRNTSRSIEQKFSMIAGSIYVVGGIIGFFITGFSNITEMTNHALLGIFMLNPYHNIVHIAIGGLWLATLLGFMGYLSLLSIPSGMAGDNFLHLVSALLPLIFGSGLLSGMSGRQAATA